MSRLALVLVAGLLLVAAACSRSSRYYFDKAGELAAGGKADEAVLMYRKAIQADDGFGEAYYKLGSLLWHNRRSQEAYAALLSAARLLPDREDVKVELADLELSSYLANDRRPTALHDKIKDICNQLLSIDARSYDGLRLKAHLAAADGSYKEAEELYARANQVKPLQPELVLGWTEVLLHDGQPKEAERLASQLIARDRGYGPIYDLLYKYYVGMKRLTDAENVLKTKVNNNPTNSGYVLELAAFYAASGREGDMQAVLRRVLDDSKTFPDTHLQVGDLYASLQRWDDALHQYEEGAKTNQRERIAYLRKIADVRLSQGRGEQAGQVVDQILQALPHDPSARGVKASLLLATGRPDDIEKAVSELKSLVDTDQGNAVWHFNLGRGLAAKGDLEGARIQFQEAVDRRRGFLPPRLALLELSQARHDYKASLQYADEILAQYPNLLRIKLVHAASLMYLGKNEQARAEFDALAHAFPNDPEVQMQLAVMKLHERRYQEAEEQFRKLAAQHYGDARAVNGLVDSLTAANQPDRAVSVLQEELKGEPESIPIRSILARTAALTGKYDLAVEQFRQLLELAPNSEATCLALGTVYRMKGDFDDAIRYLGKASMLARKDPVPMIRLGGALALAGRKPEALAVYRDALKLKPNDAATWSNSAYLIVETGGSLDEAMRFARQAIQLDSRQPSYADTLGWVYLKKNLNDSAIQVYRALTNRYPNEAAFHYHFALALLQRGDRDAARGELKTALARNPSDEIRRGIETALAKAGAA